MKYIGTLIAVKDIEKSKQFYHDVLGLDVVSDFDANVTLTGGVVLQTLETWQSFVFMILTGTSSRQRKNWIPSSRALLRRDCLRKKRRIEWIYLHDFVVSSLNGSK